MAMKLAFILKLYCLYQKIEFIDFYKFKARLFARDY
jgi:hypothetical protein